MYRVVEKFKDESLVTSDNWAYTPSEPYKFVSLKQAYSVKAYSDNYNTLLSEDQRTGQLNITKVLDNNGLTGEGGTGDKEGARLSFEVRVTGPYNYDETQTIHPGESLELKNLFYGTYKVEEVGGHENYGVAYSVPNGTVTLSKNADKADITITNTPKLGTEAVGKLTGVKVWKGGPVADHWAGGVTITLYQNGKAIASNDAYPVDEMIITPTQKGADSYSYNWIKLAKHDAHGYPFVYTLDETYKPIHYTKTVSEDGLTFTNTFDPPVRGIYAAKEYLGNETENLPQPEVTLTLQRRLPGGEWEDLKDSDGKVLSITTDKDYSVYDLPGTDPEKARWKTAMSDENGVTYSYRLVEEFVTDDPTNDNWLYKMPTYHIGTVDDAAKLIFEGQNQLVSGAHKGAQLKIGKTVVNAPAGSATSYPIEVTGPYGYKKTMTIKAGETLTLDNLYYGTYTVMETGTADGFNVSYAPANGQVTLRRPDYDWEALWDSPPSPTTSATVTITNTYPAPTDPVTPPTTYDPISVPITGLKKAVNHSLRAGDYSFTIKDGKGNTLETVKNAADGSISFKPRTFSRTGTFLYTIEEVKGAKAGIVYDSTVYTAKVAVTASGGQLTASVTILKNGTPTAGGITFVNSTKAPPTGDSHLAFPLVLMTLAMLSLGGAYIIKRRRAR